MADEPRAVSEIPIGRYLIACREVARSRDQRDFSLMHLIQNVVPRPGEPFPVQCEKFALFAMLTNGTGEHELTLTLTLMGRTDEREIGRVGPVRVEFGRDPSTLHGLPIPLDGIVFPEPGQYQFRLLHSGGQEIAREYVTVREAK